MPESNICHVRNVQVDNAAWTAISASMQASRVTMTFAVFESVLFRTDSADPNTEMAIPEGKEEVFEWPHGPRLNQGQIIGYIKSSASVGNIIVKETA